MNSCQVEYYPFLAFQRISEILLPQSYFKTLKMWMPRSSCCLCQWGGPAGLCSGTALAAAASRRKLPEVHSNRKPTRNGILEIVVQSCEVDTLPNYQTASLFHYVVYFSTIFPLYALSHLSTIDTHLAKCLISIISFNLYCYPMRCVYYYTY